MIKKNKGFTLIELLAVIVILGIILTIVVTNVVKYINDAKKGAFKDSYIKIVNEVKNRMALRQLGDSSITIECSACANEYNVDDNMNVSVFKMNDDEYLVYVNGQKSYDSITFDSDTCPKNSGCAGKFVASIISQNGSVKEAKIGNIMYAKNKTNMDSGLGIISDCSTENFCNEQGYGNDIRSITYSSAGIYYMYTDKTDIIVDKNGNILNDKEDFGKYINLISINRNADTQIKNNSVKDNYITCSSGTLHKFASRTTYGQIKYKEALLNDAYLYVYENSNNKIRIFTCIQGDSNTKPTMSQNNIYTEFIN